MSEKLSDEIYDALRHKKMTQVEIAGMLNISPAYLNQIIMGDKHGPKADRKLEAIKAILGIQKEGV